MLKKFRTKLRKFIDVKPKEDPKKVLKMVKDIEEATKEPFTGGLDEYGREIPDPRPQVVDVKPLTQEQKVLNQFIMAHNKAALELQNLPWDMSTPEKARESMAEMLNLDMPEEQAEFISNYEVIEMAQDYPQLPDQVLEPAPEPEPAAEPAPEPAPSPENG